MKQRIVRQGFVFAALLALAGFAAPQSVAAQTATKLKCNGCIKSKQIKNEGIKPKDLNKTSKPARSALTFDAGAMALPGTDTAVRTLTIAVPGPGTVLAHWSVTASGAGVVRVACSVVEDTTLGSYWELAETDGSFFNIGGVQAFPVDERGDVTLNLVCREVIGAATVYNPALALVFTPGPQNITNESATESSGKSPASGS